MALSEETKFRVVSALGYAGKVLSESSNLYNSVIADRLSNLDTYTEERVENLLDQIDTTEDKLNSAPDSFKVKQVGDIVFNSNDGPMLIRREYRRLINELSNLLDIPSRKGNSNMFQVCT